MALTVKSRRARSVCTSGTNSTHPGWRPSVYPPSRRKVPFLLELPVCLLFVAQLLICYQLWSEVPQLMNYVLGLGAVLCLALAGYFHLARAAGLPGKPWYNAVGLLGVFFCAAAVAQGTFSWFFTTAAVWLAGIYAGLAPAEG